MAFNPTLSLISATLYPNPTSTTSTPHLPSSQQLSTQTPTSTTSTPHLPSSQQLSNQITPQQLQLHTYPHLNNSLPKSHLNSFNPTLTLISTTLYPNPISTASATPLPSSQQVSTQIPPQQIAPHTYPHLNNSLPKCHLNKFNATLTLTSTTLPKSHLNNSTPPSIHCNSKCSSSSPSCRSRLSP